MAVDAHKNFAYSTIATAPSPATTGTSCVVQTGDAAKFPAVPFNATVWPSGTNPTTANAEIVRVTNIAGDTFTITRIQESTSARSIIVGDQIAATITVKTFTDLETGSGVTTLGTLTTDLLFTDATKDIGKSGATRPRDGFFSRNVVIGGTLGVTGQSTLGYTVINTNSGGITLSLAPSSGNATLDLSGSGIDQVQLVAAASGTSILKVVSNSALLLGTNNTIRITISAAGAVTIAGGQNISTTITGQLALNANTSGAAQGFQIDATNLANGSNTILTSAPTGWIGNYIQATLNAVSKFSVSQAGAVTAAGLITGASGATITGAGVQLGAPTGGDKGAGTLNVATDCYKNNTAYANPDYVFEHWATGRIKKFADKEGAASYRGLKSLKQVEAHARRYHALPRISEWRRGKTGSQGLFGGGDAVLASLEEAYLYIFQLSARIDALEAQGRV